MVLFTVHTDTGHRTPDTDDDDVLIFLSSRRMIMLCCKIIYCNKYAYDTVVVFIVK
jgi:hypothetical protein